MITKEQLIDSINKGERPYCLLSISDMDYNDVNLSQFMNGGLVDGYLDESESPFPFPVFFTLPQMPNSWHGITYYRTAIPVDENRKRI